MRRGRRRRAGACSDTCSDTCPAHANASHVTPFSFNAGNALRAGEVALTTLDHLFAPSYFATAAITRPPGAQRLFCGPPDQAQVPMTFTWTIRTVAELCRQATW